MKISISAKAAPAPVVATPPTAKFIAQMKKFGNEKHFLTLSGPSNKPGKLELLESMWHKANDLFFKGKLPAPKFKLLPYIADFSKTKKFYVGQYSSSDNKFNFAPRAFNAPYSIICTTLVHEMCHQAVAQLEDGLVEGNGGHGPHWEAWMKKCGLPPRYITKGTRTDFMLPDERKAFLSK